MSFTATPQRRLNHEMHLTCNGKRRPSGRCLVGFWKEGWNSLIDPYLNHRDTESTEENLRGETLPHESFRLQCIEVPFS